jgi:hypothetical protein
MAFDRANLEKRPNVVQKAHQIISQGEMIWADTFPSRNPAEIIADQVITDLSSL